MAISRRSLIASTAAGFFALPTSAISQSSEQRVRPGRSPARDVCSISNFNRERWMPARDYGAVLTNERARDGNRSLRLELRYGDCGQQSRGGHDDCSHGNERVEFAAYSPRQGEGDIYRYGWSAYFPEAFPRSSFSGQSRPELFLGQFHDSDGWLFSMFYGGWRPGNGGLMVKGPHDGTDFHGPWRAPVLSRAQMLGRWNDLIVDANWTRRSDGFFRVGVNGRYVASYEGPTLARGSEVYLKLGIYRLNTIPSAGTAVVYYDRIFRQRL